MYLNLGKNLVFLHVLEALQPVQNSIDRRIMGSPLGTRYSDQGMTRCHPMKQSGRLKPTYL